MRDENISEFSAIQKWKKIPKEFRVKILANIYCVKCGISEMQTGYTIQELSHGDIVLNGKCKKCGGAVSRVVEGE